MVPGYKDDSFMIVQPGSLFTLVTFGLQDPLGLPSHSVPTVVYQNQEDNSYSLQESVSSRKIHPINQGNIVDNDAFKFFIHSTASSVLKDHNDSLKEPSQNEDESTPTIKNSEQFTLEHVNLLIVQTSGSWNPFYIENIANYAFETMNVHSISVIPLELCVVFSHGSLANALVIDLGYEKSEITPIIDYQIFNPGKKIINKGGSSINQVLSKLLPQLSESQIEDLKKSSIFECLSEEDAKKSFFGMEGLIENLDENKEDDGILDIAAIVTSDKSTRELLEDNKKSKVKVDTRPNSELETNTFEDSESKELTIGKERFQGCNDLIDTVVFNIYHALKKVPDLKKRQDCYDNIIITGQTSKIKGLKEKIIFHLFNNYVIISDNKLLQPQSQFRNDVRPVDDSSISQVPRHLKLVPRVEYFSEWKKLGFEDCSFLGAEILSKQVFNQSNEFCLSREIYDEKGPSAIWDTAL